MEFQINTIDDLIDFIRKYGTNDKIALVFEVCKKVLPPDAIFMLLSFTDTDNIPFVINQLENIRDGKEFNLQSIYKSDQ